MEPNPVKFSPLIIGTMRLGQWGISMNRKSYQEFIEGCLDIGLLDFDHADIYGDYTTEKEFGDVLRAIPSLRQKMQLTCKVGIKMVTPNRPFHHIKSYDTSKAHIINSVHNSLRQLNTDYLDVLLIHRPDMLMDIHEVAELFFELKKEGKVLHFGASNFNHYQLAMLNEVFPLCTNQVEASILHLDPLLDGTFDQCQLYGISPTIWSPLGRGLLFESESKDPRIKRISNAAHKLMEKYQASLDQILLAWLIKHPSGPIPILGTTKLDRIKSGLDALSIHLTREEWYQLYIASIGEDVP